MDVNPNDWTLAPGEPKDDMPPQAPRINLLARVVRRAKIDEAEDKTLADPDEHWRLVR